MPLDPTPSHDETPALTPALRLTLAVGLCTLAVTGCGMFLATAGVSVTALALAAAAGSLVVASLVGVALHRTPLALAPLPEPAPAGAADAAGVFIRRRLQSPAAQASAEPAADNGKPAAASATPPREPEVTSS